MSTTPWTDARLRGIASDYFPDSAHWPAAMLCMRHLLMEQTKAAPSGEPVGHYDGEHRDGADMVKLYSDTPKGTLLYTLPPGWVMAPTEPTPEMVSAYLAGNAAYWQGVDDGPKHPAKWRNGTPAEATAEAYRAMIAATPKVPA